MALTAKTDPFTGAVGKCVSTDENKSATEITQLDETGSINATSVVDEHSEPSAEYIGTASAGIGYVGVLGGAGPTVATSVTMTSTAGSAPTMTISGRTLPTGKSLGHSYSVTAPSWDGSHHGKSVPGLTTNGHILSSSYTASCDLSLAQADGEVEGADVTNGVEEVTMTSTQTITVSDGWNLTGPCSMSNPNGEYPTYTATARRALSHSTSAS